MKLTKITLITLLALALALAACGQPATPTQTEPGGQTGGGTGTESTAPPPPPPPATDIPAPVLPSLTKDLLLDPANSPNADSATVTNYLYEGLTKIEGGQAAPALAVSWSISDDQLDYIFELRPGVTFHDGSPLNADAVIANFNRWFDPEDAAHGDGAYTAWLVAFLGFKGEKDDAGKPKPSFDGIEKVNDLTVLIHLNRPDADLLTKLADPAFSIVNPAAFTADFGTAAGTASGTGPYMLGAWDDATLVLTPNAAYWNTAPAAEIKYELK